HCRRFVRSGENRRDRPAGARQGRPVTVTLVTSWRPPFGGPPRGGAVLPGGAFAVAVGCGVVAPAIPVYAREFGVGRTAAGAVISAFAFMRLVSALGSGRLVNRIGERLVLSV